MMATPVKTLRVLGITDEFCVCDCCGKSNLKSTVAMERCDEDGNGTGDIIHYGSECAARALKIRDHSFRKNPTKRFHELAIEGINAARAEIFAKHCKLIETSNGGYYILNETRLSELPGTMQERINAAVMIRNDRFPFLNR